MSPCQIRHHRIRLALSSCCVTANRELNISSAAQPPPGDLSEAFVSEAKFVDTDLCALLLSDVFNGFHLAEKTQPSDHPQPWCKRSRPMGETPEPFSMTGLDANNMAISTDERPANPKSRMAVTAFYLYDSLRVEIAHSMRPAVRGELEISDMTRVYPAHGELPFQVFGSVVARRDTGPHEVYVEESTFAEAREKRPGLKTAYPEETRFRPGYVDATEPAAVAAPVSKSDHGP